MNPTLARLDPLDGTSLVLDIETSSACDIKSGAWAYSQHSSTIIYCVVFGWQETSGARHFVEWVPQDGDLPDDIRDFVVGGGSLVAHNVSFEHAIWTNILAPVYGWPQPDDGQWRDTQAVGLYYNLPQSLKGLSGIVGASSEAKDTDGAKLMKAMANPIGGTDGQWVYDTDPEHIQRLVEYCRQDVVATLACWTQLKQLPLDAAVQWRADQAVNRRGVQLDVEYAGRILATAEKRSTALQQVVEDETLGVLKNATATPALKGWVKAAGVTLPVKVTKKKTGASKSETLDATATEKLLALPDLPPTVRTVLSIRKEANKITSLQKLKRVPLMVGSDGRLRNALQFCGAHTGRWTSYGLQLHNLPKNKLSKPVIDAAETAVRWVDHELLDILVDNPLASLSQLLRRVIIARFGYELIAADYSAIEARVLAWLCYATKKLDLFHAGEDVYVHTAASIGSGDRQLGKVCDLALGYGMGVMKFDVTAADAGCPMELRETYRVHRAWRGDNPEVCSFWHELEDAVRTSILEGVPTTAGRIRVGCPHSRGARVLTLVLPSGRALCYWSPHIVRTTKKIQSVTEDGVIVEREMTSDEIRFLTMGSDKTKMVPESTYGGKLVENVTQGVARDILSAGLTKVEAHPVYHPVVHVHDSLAAEVLNGTGDVQEFCDLLTDSPAWAAGLPLKAEGYRSDRFNG